MNQHLTPAVDKRAMHRMGAGIRGVPFEEKLTQFTAELAEQMALGARIRENLAKVGLRLPEVKL